MVVFSFSWCLVIRTLWGKLNLKKKLQTPCQEDFKIISTVIDFQITQHEADLISQRTKAALQQLKKQGVQLGNKDNFNNA